jgi:recombination protein RecT
VSTAVAKQGAEVRQIKELLERSADRLLAVLPRHMTPEKMIQVVSTLAFKTPRLLECDRTTILSAVLEACELGLELSPKLGQAYLVPYWNNKAKVYECQLQPGYRGLIKLALNSGKVLDVEADVVRANDEFRYARSPDLQFYHEPNLDDPGKVVRFYALAKLASGVHKVEVMTAEQVEAIRRRSKSADSGPWVTDWEEMGRKCPIKRLCKRLPLSPELERALEADDRQYEDGPPSVVSAPPARAFPTRSAALAARLSGPPAEEPEFVEGTPGRIASEADEGDFEGDPGDDANYANSAVATKG